jgi:hypothetical protein
VRLPALAAVAVLAASLLTQTAARAQIDFGGFTDDIPSLTGAREAEMLATYAFAKERPLMYAPLPLLHLPVTPYTEYDDEAPWSEVRVDAALAYARHSLGRCGIVLDRGPLGRTERKKMDAGDPKLLRNAGHGETLVYFVDDIPGRTVGTVAASETKYPFPFIRIQNDVPVLTVLPHMLGLRLNATVSERPYSLMLNDRTLVTAFGASLTGAAGFFDPRRFIYTDEDCDVMREALLRETQCAPRAHVYAGRGHERGRGDTVAERRAARAGRTPWPLGTGAPDDILVAPSQRNDGLMVFALHAGRWRGFFWPYLGSLNVGRDGPERAEVYAGFEQPGGLGLAVQPAGQEIRLLTFAEGNTVEVHSTPWPRPWAKGRTRPVRLDRVPCRVMLAAGPVGQGAERPLAVVCHDRIWRIYKEREPEMTLLPRPAKWASMTRRCNDDVQIWLGLDTPDRALELVRLPAYGPPEPEPLPPWATWPAVREVPFTAVWGGTPRSLDRVTVRRFDAQVSPQWGPAVREPPPSERGQWVRYEDTHGPGWVGFVDGELRVE